MGQLWAEYQQSGLHTHTHTHTRAHPDIHICTRCTLTKNMYHKLMHCVGTRSTLQFPFLTFYISIYILLFLFHFRQPRVGSASRGYEAGSPVVQLSSSLLKTEAALCPTTHHVTRRHSPKENNTGRFIMYSGITKIYYRKPVGHVFTKPVQIEGTTQTFFPVSCFST